MRLRLALASLLPLTFGACSTLPFKIGDLPLDHAKNEHAYVVYVVATDNNGKTSSGPATFCSGGSESVETCGDGLGAYADDAKQIQGALIIGKTADKAFRMNSVILAPSLFDTLRTATPLRRNLVLTLEGMETPLHVSGTDSANYRYFTAKMEPGGQAVRVDPATSCARVDAVYMGVFEFHIKESSMPIPEVAFRTRPNNVHMKQMALLKFRSGASLACYAVPKNAPKARIRSIRS